MEQNTSDERVVTASHWRLLQRVLRAALALGDHFVDENPVVRDFTYAEILECRKIADETD